METLVANKLGPVQGPRKVADPNISMSNPNRKRESTNEITRPVKKLKDVSKVHENTQAKIERIVEAMDSYVRSVQRDLKIQVHRATGQIMVKVISKENGKVIREIPAGEILDLAAKLEEMAGALFNEKA
ncbi:MAG: flagellar protein FlaG [Deltaproteobacteria bacterium]|nr:flagellar protein FlaG [Deltaproteobacteria bacterium]